MDSERDNTLQRWGKRLYSSIQSCMTAIAGQRKVQEAKPLQRILIIGPAWIGDMVMAQTLCLSLKTQYPDALIDVLAPAWTHPLLKRMPEVNAAILLTIAHGEWGWTKRKTMGLHLKAAGYDQAFVLPNSFKSALIPFWANIPVRTGWRREMRGILLNDPRTLDKKRYPLMTQRFMALALPEQATLLSYRPHLEVDKVTVAAVQQKFGITAVNAPILALCPGAEFGPAKRWPVSYFAEIAQYWLAQEGQVWLFGSQKDRAICEEIDRQTEGSCRVFAGDTDLGEAIDLLSLVTAVVTNDSGLMHISAALNKPIVAVYGSSDPGFTPPLGDHIAILRLNLPCSPCFKRVCPLTHLNCLTQLLPAQVKAALEGLLA